MNRKLRAKRNVLIAITAALGAVGVMHTQGAEAGVVIAGAATTYTQQWIKNNAGAAQTNMELTFTAPITNAKVKGVGTAGATVTANTAKSYTITGINIANGSEIDLRWATNAKPPAKLSTSKWTPSNLNIGAAWNNLPAPPVQITYNKYIASATFSNDSTGSVDYTNVQLFANATGSNFDLDDFDTTSGTQVGTTSFILGPGDSRVVPIGAINPDAYALVLATAAYDSDPTTTFDMATGASAPEPVELCALALGGLVLLRKRRRA